MTDVVSEDRSHWDLAAAVIAVKIRWFGLILGVIYVNFASSSPNIGTLNSILTLGLAYTLIDTYSSLRGRVFLAAFPLAISILEAVFITLLCYFDTRLDSPFRYYFLLSLVCCAIRHSRTVTYLTCAMDCLSYSVLYFDFVNPRDTEYSLPLMLVVMVWVTWAANSMSHLLKIAGSRLVQLNSALLENQSQLESRIEERTRELQESQAQLMHQDKMAGFGLLAAGIAHEVGNPLTSISSLVQMIDKREADAYTREKLGLVAGQLTRIRGILRELIDFSRPASFERRRFTIHEIVDESLNIAKYYTGTKSRSIRNLVPRNLGTIEGVRDQIVQIVFNLVLNAIDATGRGGIIELRATQDGERLSLEVSDDGAGIAPERQKMIFRPYFTTKPRGTGLGLFVTKKLIEEHGGQVWFESKLGEGTTFSICLPAEQCEIESAEESFEGRAIRAGA